MSIVPTITSSVTVALHYVPAPEKGDSAVSVRLDPPQLVLKKGVAATYDVKIYLLDGVTESKPEFFNTLTDAQKEGFASVAYINNDKYGCLLRFAYGGESTIDRDIPVVVEDKYHVTLPVRTISDGEPGKEGAMGAVTSVTKWQTATDYYDGKTPRPDGIKVFNIVYIETSSGGRRYFACLSSHTSGVQTKPGSGALWSTCWSELSNAGPLFTEFLLAPNARIDLLDSQEIILWHTGPDGEQIMDARIGPPTDSNDRTIAWFGGSTPASAVTRINEDGSIYSRKGVFEGDVVFGGRIVPMRTVITKDNYKQYRGGEPGNYYLDFRTLTGHVTLDASLDNVSLDDFAMIFYVASKYPDQSPMVENIDDYVGSRLVVKNNASSDAAASGYVSPIIDNPGAYSALVHPGNEIRLFCFVAKNSSNKKVIGWHVEYVGPQ